MVWEGKGAIKTGRVMLGATNPADSLPGTIRGDLCVDMGRNICHGSDSPDAAKHEINFWFSPQEIQNWNPATHSWVYETPSEAFGESKQEEPVVEETGGDSSGALEGEAGSTTERTFIAIKPDGVQRRLIGNIIARFEAKGFRLAAMRVMTPSKEKAAGHYADLSKKAFFGGLVNFFSSGPICAMVWEGKGAIKTGRVMLGATNPADSLPGTIRGDLCVDMGRNICHGSDSPDAAKHEINFWFSPQEIQNWTPATHSWVYETPSEAFGESKQEEPVVEETGGDSSGALEGEAGSTTERTFIAIKPDGVQRGLIGNIIARFEKKGFKLAAMRVMPPPKEKAAGHY